MLWFYKGCEPKEQIIYYEGGLRRGSHPTEEVYVNILYESEQGVLGAVYDVCLSVRQSSLAVSHNAR